MLTADLGEQVNPTDAHEAEEDDHLSQSNLQSPAHTPPSSSPPSFRSRASSPNSTRLLSQDDPFHNEDEQTLADTFDDGEALEDENGGDDRQRLMRADLTSSLPRAGEAQQPPVSQPLVGATTGAPAQTSSLPRENDQPSVPTTGALRQQPRGGNDGVFANLAAKPERGQTMDEKLPVRKILSYRSLFL